MISTAVFKQPLREGAILLRSLLFYAGMLVSLVIFAVIALLVLPLPYLLRYRIVTQWSHLNLWWLQKTCKLNWRVRGLENIPKGPAIVMCKHQSAWETMALQKILPPHVWVLKRELLWLPLFGWGLATLRPIAINRKAGRLAIQQILEQGTVRLKAGHWVTIFPEGTRVAPGEKRRYGVGGGVLAEKTGYSIVPMAHNAGLFWPRKSIKKFPGTIEVVIGTPIDPKGKTATEIMACIEEWIENTSNQLLHQSGQ